jgi:chromate transporter
MNKKLMWKLFTSTFVISAFTVGGGYVIVPMMKKKFVDELHWLEEQEMLDITAIGSSAPGVIAVNTSILLGYRVGGLLGALITVLATVLPPLITISIISLVYNAFRSNVVVAAVLHGMQAGVAALMVDAVISLTAGVAKQKDIFADILMVAAFLAVFCFKAPVVLVIIACGILGFLRSLILKGAKK